MQQAIDLIKQFEGLRLKAYLCPAGKWTIGYGHTDGVNQGDEINEAFAEELLEEDVEEFKHRVDDLLHCSLPDQQMAVLISFAFNVGIRAFAKSTLLKELNKGNFEQVPVELAKWNKITNPKTGKKEVSQGLTNRRNAEIELCSS